MVQIKPVMFGQSMSVSPTIGISVCEPESGHSHKADNKAVENHLTFTAIDISITALQHQFSTKAVSVHLRPSQMQSMRMKSARGRRGHSLILKDAEKMLSKVPFIDTVQSASLCCLTVFVFSSIKINRTIEPKHSKKT